MLRGDIISLQHLGHSGNVVGRSIVHKKVGKRALFVVMDVMRAIRSPFCINHDMCSRSRSDTPLVERMTATADLKLPVNPFYPLSLPRMGSRSHRELEVIVIQAVQDDILGTPDILVLILINVEDRQKLEASPVLILG